MTNVTLSMGEARAFKRFRVNNDAMLIKKVLERELGLAREVNETEVASEESRLHVQAIKRTIDLLFNDELHVEKAE